MAHVYQPTRMSAYAETPDNQGLFQGIYGVHVCYENAFDDAMMTTMYGQLVGRDMLVPITVRTGGGRSGVRFPDRIEMRGNAEALVSLRDNNQFKLSRHIGGKEALAQVQSYYQAQQDNGYQWGGAKPAKENEVNLSMASFMWRYTHRRADGTFPLIPATAEISHLAEAYSEAHPEWGIAKVEVTQMESSAVNESRKTCTRLGLMWLKPNGSVIGEYENYTGATQCPHASVNSPCYAPYPAQWKTPTGATDNVRKAGGKKKRKDGGGKDSKAKKQATGGKQLQFETV